MSFLVPSAAHTLKRSFRTSCIPCVSTVLRQQHQPTLFTTTRPVTDNTSIATENGSDGEIDGSQYDTSDLDKTDRALLREGYVEITFDELRELQRQRKKRLSSAEALEEAKSLGKKRLEETTRMVEQKAGIKKPLFDPRGVTGSSIKQMTEEKRILKTANDALEKLYDRGDKTFCVDGDPIYFLECEVNVDLRYANLGWTLPVSVMDLRPAAEEILIDRMQDKLRSHGSKIQRAVHNKLRHYYPPKLRFFALRDDTIRNAVQGDINDSADYDDFHGLDR
uniref:Uncharacterized protein n=1 Tax=Grammatophora oceanica TaxID=210454 RepID=A0A7S1Y2L3_9STRA|mmetsp:Transcript_14349/g.21032  ORF Transcript_14349/g.21032 Transcript_14349/m.21032 type:complete len:279 (+) Transcript_14349:53-889(+)